MKKDNLIKLICEIFRFGVVGGISFVVDTAIVLLFNRVIFSQPEVNPDLVFTAISTAIGFLVGLTVNYILSRIFVFTSAKQKENGKGLKAFIIFAVVSVIGLVLTELLVLGLCAVGLVDFWSKVIAAGIVMIWNYLGRKILIFK